MQIIDRGNGIPLVLVPGIQGRWEYMRPAVDALAESLRVITFPLCDERGSGPRFDPAQGIDNFVNQIDAVLDDRNLQTAVICGVSFGGLAALRFAARRADRTTALVLVSTPGPGWHLKPRHAMYARLPWLFGPVFFAETPWRLRAEVETAIPDLRQRWRFAWRQVRTLACAPVSPSRMAARAVLIGEADLMQDCAVISAPTLVISGEPALDHVVRVDETSAYVRLIPGAQAARLEHTGHLGSITRPDLFAAVVKQFVADADSARDRADRGAGSPGVNNAA